MKNQFSKNPMTRNLLFANKKTHKFKMKLVATRLLTAKEVSFRISDYSKEPNRPTLLCPICNSHEDIPQHRFFCYKTNEEKTIIKRQIRILELIGRYQKARINVLTYF